MPMPDEWAEARSIFEQFSPDQKKKFLDNLNQWKAMSPEEQELYRDRELFRREKIAEEIQDAITKSGLKLDEDQREVFALRYTQERRKIEEALHKEMDAERQAMVGEMLGRLKTEFSGTPDSSPVVIAPDRSSQ
jgi:dsDNA-binding SOS-regulon protein